MPRRFTGKLCRFLFDHLEGATFGERLRWVDREAGVFQIFWRHGNGSSSTPEEDCAVFMAWHHYKNRRIKKCAPMEAKQRFRAAMHKMKLTPVNSWNKQRSEKNFQYRKFPKEDLGYLFKKMDQRVPSSPSCSSGEVSDADSERASFDVVSDSDAYPEPASPDDVTSAVSKPTVEKRPFAVQQTEECRVPEVILDSPMTSLCPEAPLESDNHRLSFPETDPVYNWERVQDSSVSSDLFPEAEDDRYLPSAEGGTLPGTLPGFSEVFGPLVAAPTSCDGQCPSLAVLKPLDPFSI
ncbi:uncharacterized protein LOC144136543 [Amblyomma americanum]